MRAVCACVLLTCTFACLVTGVAALTGVRADEWVTGQEEMHVDEEGNFEIR